MILNRWDDAALKLGSMRLGGVRGRRPGVHLGHGVAMDARSLLYLAVVHVLL